MSERQLTEAVMFPELDDEQLAVVLALGERREVREGEVLFSPADDHYDWIVILSGLVEVFGPNGQVIISPLCVDLLGQQADVIDVRSSMRRRNPIPPPTTGVRRVEVLGVQLRLDGASTASTRAARERPERSVPSPMSNFDSISQRVVVTGRRSREPPRKSCPWYPSSASSPVLRRGKPRPRRRCVSGWCRSGRRPIGKLAASLRVRMG